MSRVNPVFPFVLLALGVVVGILTGCQQESEPDIQLAGTAWTLVSLDGQPPLEGSRITLTFTDKEIRGVAGCNHYGGRYRQEGSHLAVEALFQTEMACFDPPGVMEQEQHYLETLARVTAYRTVGRDLWLETRDGARLIFAPADR